MSKKNITNRLFLQMGIIILSFSAIIILVNTLLLQPLQYREIKNEMVAVLGSLKEIDFSEDISLWQETLETISDGNDFDIIIEDMNAVIYSSSVDGELLNETANMVTGDPIEPVQPVEPQGENGLQPNKNEVVDKGRMETGVNIRVIRDFDDWKEYRDGLLIGIVDDSNSNGDLMVGIYQLSEEIYLYFVHPLGPINGYIKKSNELLLICTLIFLGISMIVAYRTSIKFTKPIKEIQRQVNRLTQLDFSDKLSLKTGDELENLGEDINHLSNKLEDSLEILKQQNLQLEKDIVSQRRMLSNVSHELRTPLSLIKGYADEVNAGFITDSKQQKLVIKYISEESTKMSRLINEILELSQLESGRMNFLNGNYNVEESILGFLEKYDGFVTKNKLNIIVDTDSEATGYFDAVRFEQILANYVLNASKYCDDQRLIKIHTKVEESFIRIYVYNSGQQILADDLEHIWDGFYKADESRANNHESFGLGLSVVKAIQDLAEQDYGVINEADGVAFWFNVNRVTS